MPSSASFCPSCDQPIEAPETDARAGVKCPECGAAFVPKNFHEVEPVKFSVSEHTMKLGALPGWQVKVSRSPMPDPEWFKLSKRGVSFGTVSVVCMVIAAICFLFAVGAVLDESGDTHFYNGAAACAGFIVLAFMCSVIGHLLHIRAALEKGRENGS
jgi:hypothetical protein